MSFADSDPEEEPNPFLRASRIPRTPTNRSKSRSKTQVSQPERVQPDRQAKNTKGVSSRFTSLFHRNTPAKEPFTFKPEFLRLGEGVTAARPLPQPADPDQENYIDSVLDKALNQFTQEFAPEDLVDPEANQQEDEPNQPPGPPVPLQLPQVIQFNLPAPPAQGQ